MSGQRACRACGQRRGERVTTWATHAKVTREWRLWICRDCWRCWETVMDESADGIQPQLEHLGSGRTKLNWFF